MARQLGFKRELPRYRLSGYKVSKYFQLTYSLEELLREFCLEDNINQRDMMEIGLIEALRKYGYAAEVKGILNG